MANREHLEILKQGVEVWNAWREEHPSVQPDLAGANLADTELSGADLSNTKLSGANLKRANLRAAVLSAETTGAALVGADLEGAHIGSVVDAIRLDAPKAMWSHVHVGERVDFDPLHDPGDASYWLIRQGEETLQESLLRRIDEQSTKEEATTEFHSCFISYSHADKNYARRLHDHLRTRGIRCWLDEHDLKPGDRILDVVSDAIRLHDKILLCCSESSLESWWVKDEIRKAQERERRDGRDIIIPLMVDRYLLDRWEDGLATDLRSRLAADFTGWEHDNAVFEEQFERVVKALRADEGALGQAET